MTIFTDIGQPANKCDEASSAKGGKILYKMEASTQWAMRYSSI